MDHPKGTRTTAQKHRGSSQSGIDSNVLLEAGEPGGSTSTAPKPSSEDPTSTTDADARATEEMADSMLRDSPVPEIEEGR